VELELELIVAPALGDDGGARKSAADEGTSL